MDLEKIIRLSVNATDAKMGVRNIADSLKDLNEEILSGIKSRTSSQEEFNKALEREIALREQSRKTYSAEAKSEYDIGMFNARDESTRRKVSDQYDDAIQASKLDFEANKVLEDILEELKRQAKFEEAESRKDAETGPKLDRKGFAMVQNENGVWVRDNSAQIEAMELADTRRGYMTARGVGSSIINANNIGDAGLDVMGTGGGMLMATGASATTIGIGAAILLAVAAAKKVFDKDTEYQKNIRESKALTGIEISGENSGKYTGIGYSDIDRTAMLDALQRTRRSGRGAEQALESQMYLKKGIGLSESDYGNVEQLSYLGGQTGMSNIQGSISGMRSAGIVKGDDYSAVSPYLELIVNLAKEQVTRLGKIDYGVNSRLITAVASMSDVMRLSPEALSSMLQGVQGGLEPGGSPQMTALKMRVLSKLKPGASPFEMMEMMERGAREPGYMEGMQDEIKDMSGGGDAGLWMTKNIFSKLGFAQTRTLRDKGKQFTDELSKPFGGEGVAELTKRAEEATPWKTVETAKMENRAVATGEAVVGLLGQIAEHQKEQVQGIQDEIKAIGNVESAIKRMPQYLPPQ